MPEARKEERPSRNSTSPRAFCRHVFRHYERLFFVRSARRASPIGEASAAAGTSTIWTGLPKLVVVLLGGFTTNFIWCVLLNIKNAPATNISHPMSGRNTRIDGLAGHGARTADLKVPVLGNYLFSALAGTTWYFQFFFYTMGETQMGKYNFASWTLHMASIIIFSTMWGWVLHEWKGSSRKAHGLIAAGIATLILSTVIIGYGTYLKSKL